MTAFFLLSSTETAVSPAGAVVSIPFLDSFPALSLAAASTSVPGFTLSFGSVMTPLSLSTVTSDPSGTDHLPSSPFVAVTVFSVPSGAVYFTVIDLVSSSVGGVMVTLPSLLALTVGFPGASVSFCTSLYPVIVSWDPSG